MPMKELGKSIIWLAILGTVLIKARPGLAIMGLKFETTAEIVETHDGQIKCLEDGLESLASNQKLIMLHFGITPIAE